MKRQRCATEHGAGVQEGEPHRRFETGA